MKSPCKPLLLRRSACALLAISTLLPAPLPTNAQSTNSSEAEQIREQLKALQRDYEERMRLLEDRLQALERSSPPAPMATNAIPVVTNSILSLADRKARAREFADREFQRDTESREYSMRYDEGPLAKRVEQVLQDFLDIHGYFRAGYGRDDQGGPQTGFQAPGALAKYRLGNEAENYGELSFGKNFYVPGLFKRDAQNLSEEPPPGPLARVQATMSIYNPYQDLLNSGSTDFGLPEVWASIGNVVASQPLMKFWAGSRYYRRHDIHINDFYFYNMSGTGGGVEDIELSFGKVAGAWIGAASTSGFSDLPEPDPNNKAGFSKGNWDLRLYDVPLPLGKGEFGFVYARSDSGLDENGRSAPDSDGVAFTFLHTRERMISPDGINKFSVQFGTAAAKNFTSGFETFNTPNGAFIRPDAPDSWRFRVTEHFYANISEHFSIGPALVYQLTDYHEGEGKEHWFSTGVRPIWHLNKYVDLASEFGVDWVENQATGESGPLYKLTLAPQVSLGNRFMSRPVIRAFVTYAHWGNDLVGLIGGSDYRNDNQGLTYGVQMEAWW